MGGAYIALWEGRIELCGRGVYSFVGGAYRALLAMWAGPCSFVRRTCSFEGGAYMVLWGGAYRAVWAGRIELCGAGRVELFGRGI